MNFRNNFNITVFEITDSSNNKINDMMNFLAPFYFLLRSQMLSCLSKNVKSLWSMELTKTFEFLLPFKSVLVLKCLQKSPIFILPPYDFTPSRITNFDKFPFCSLFTLKISEKLYSTFWLLSECRKYKNATKTI
jgi:hypothetical protein